VDKKEGVWQAFFYSNIITVGIFVYNKLTACLNLHCEISVK